MSNSYADILKKTKLKFETESQLETEYNFFDIMERKPIEETPNMILNRFKK